MRAALTLVFLAAGCATGGGPVARGGDAGIPGSRDAGRDSGLVQASDAGRDAGPPDAGPLPDVGPPDAGCAAVEVCDARDDDCDGRVDEGGVCPCDVVERGDRAYLFCEDRRSWLAARGRCELVGYSLATLEDAAEDAFVYGELASRGFPNTWVGLNDVLEEGAWVWLDGAPVTYEHWDDGEPNDGGDDGEDCGVVMRDSGRQARWDDRECDSERPYACEGPYPAP